MVTMLLEHCRSLFLPKNGSSCDYKHTLSEITSRSCDVPCGTAASLYLRSLGSCLYHAALPLNPFIQ